MNKIIVFIIGLFSILLLTGSFVYFLSNEWFFHDFLTEALAMLLPLVVIIFFAFMLLNNIKKHH